MTAVDLVQIRNESWQLAHEFGYRANEALPLLELRPVQRTLDETVDRLFAIHCAAACAFGCDRAKAIAWCRRELAVNCFTSYESELIAGDTSGSSVCQIQVESLWALCWCLRLSKLNLDFFKYCPKTLVKLLPDILVDETGEKVRKRARFQDISELTRKLDLAYCLHWCIVDAALNNRPRNLIDDYVIIQRRHALEWLFSREEWEFIALDT